MHEVLTTWFQQQFGRPTPVQERAWAAIRGGAHTLIASPTGSGKTLAALLPCLDAIVQNRDSEREPGVRVLYVTPLKALNNDIHTHVFQFVAEMEQVAEQLGIDWPGIRADVRTGDTTPAQRTSMLRKPPDLLITTPESLHILLTSHKGRQILRGVERIILDEIHDLAADRRGVHLSLTLERHAQLCGYTPQCIGVSATQKPLERVARFLGGWSDDAPRPVEIVEHRADKVIELSVQVPPEPDQNALDRDTYWQMLLQTLSQRLEHGATTLIFVNNRRLCERLTQRLNEHFGREIARSHHSSVSREKRFEVERMLKQGELTCLVATSSLELGIDVGHIDQVIQIDSPKRAASGIQRLGRAGHAVDGVSRGVIVAKHKSELAEIAVLTRDIVEREIEAIRIPRNCLDVLAQQIAAMVATDDWHIGDLHKVILGSDCYQVLPAAQLHALLKVLSGFYPFAKPLLDWNLETGLLTRRSHTQFSALMGAGTIPHSSNYPVYHQESGIRIGELDEEFVNECQVGDVFQLGTSGWMIRSIARDRVLVTEIGNRYSEIPFWRAEGVGRSFELGRKVGHFLDELTSRIADGTAEQWLGEAYFFATEAAGHLIRNVQEQSAVSQVPTHQQIVAEHFRDEMSGQYHLVVHSLLGKRLNRTWMLALQRHFEQVVSSRVHAFAQDDGMQFVFSEWQDEWLQALWQVQGERLPALLREALPASPMFSITFRRLAETSLLLMRGYSRTPAWVKRVRSEELLKSALPYAEQFPLIHEAMQECLQEWLDLPHLLQLLGEVARGDVRIIVQKSRLPTPFARLYMSDYYQTQLYEGEGFGADLQLQLLGLQKGLAVDLFGANGQQEIDGEVLAEKQERLQAKPHDAESLYRWLKERGDLTDEQLRECAGEGAEQWLTDLAARHRVTRVSLGSRERWVCRDEREVYAAFGQDQTATELILGRYRDTRVQFTESDLCEQFALTSEQARRIVEDWVEAGQVAVAPHGSPTTGSHQERVWVSRKILTRLVRRTLHKRRSRTTSVEADRLLGHLLDLHRLTPAARREGTDGLREVIGQLQGLFLPLSHWETILFPPRLTHYRKQDLDLLCATGDVLWIGKKEPGKKEGRVAFFLRESTALYAPLLRRADGESSRPELLDLLERKGASFLASLNKELGGLPSDVLEAVFDLVWEGRVSNDQFTPLRNHAAPKTKRSNPLQAGVGRWYRIDAAPVVETKQEESALAWAQQLMKRSGLLAKAVCDDDLPYAWQSMREVAGKLEEWGTVSRGLFVREIASVQYATQDQLAQLMQGKAQPGVVVLSAVDPANPYGQLIDWPKHQGDTYARKPGHVLVIENGRWVLWIENKGKRLFVLDAALQQRLDEGDAAARRLLHTAFREMLRLLGGGKTKIEVWNGEPVLSSPACQQLRDLGAERDRNALVLWSSSLNSTPV